MALPDLSEEELIVRAKAGDRDAFGELVRRCQGHAYARALGLWRNEADAWDGVCETFARAWANVRKFSGGEFAAWLKTIQLNYFRDSLRRRKSRGGRHEPLDADPREDGPPRPQPADPAPGPEESLLAREAESAMDEAHRRALASLNPVYRCLLLLVDLRPQRRCPGRPAARGKRPRVPYPVVVRYFRLLSALPGLAQAVPYQEGLRRAELAGLYEELKASKNAWYLKLFHARDAFLKALVRQGVETP